MCPGGSHPVCCGHPCVGGLGHELTRPCFASEKDRSRRKAKRLVGVILPARIGGATRLARSSALHGRPMLARDAISSSDDGFGLGGSDGAWPFDHAFRGPRHLAAMCLPCVWTAQTQRETATDTCHSRKLTAAHERALEAAAGCSQRGRGRRGRKARELAVGHAAAHSAGLPPLVDSHPCYTNRNA